MNSEINKKTPAFIYAKEFKLSKILGNLQAYKLATGEVGEAEKKEASEKHGDDLGAIYGSLVTKASWNSKREAKEAYHSVTSEGQQKKKRNGKRKQDDVDVLAEYQKTKKGQNSTTVVSTVIDSEPLPLPECLLKDTKDSASDKEESERSSDEDCDFFGLSDTTKTRMKSTPKISPERKIERNQSQDTPNINMLTTYTCWKCKRRGHLPEHCTVIVDILCKASSRQHNIKNNASIDATLQDLYMQCRKLKNARTGASCHECGNSSNLAHCFECGLTFCDGRGHLINHFLNFPTHNTVYSYKLRRLLKCSNRSCNIVDVTKLRTCSQCLSKTFDKEYSLVNATWSNRGLHSIINAITCTAHYRWHRMNCYNSFEEILINQEKLEKLKHEQNGLLSEFFF